jgi:Enoyl-(Acyl carrier protein) reductase
MSITGQRRPLSPIHAVSDAGSRAVRHHRQLHCPRRNRDREDHADGHSGQPEQPRSGRVALRRLGTVADCARVVEFLATDLSDYVTGAVIPIDGGLRADNSVVGRGHLLEARARPKPRWLLYKKYTFHLYSEDELVDSKLLITISKEELASPRGFEPLLPP